MHIVCGGEIISEQDAAAMLATGAYRLMRNGKTREVVPAEVAPPAERGLAKKARMQLFGRRKYSFLERLRCGGICWSMLPSRAIGPPPAFYLLDLVVGMRGKDAPRVASWYDAQVRRRVVKHG